MSGKRLSLWALVLVVLFCPALLVLPGCLPERIDGTVDALSPVDYGIDNSSYEAMRATTPSHVEESIGTAISIDAEVVMPERASTAILNAEPMRFDLYAESVAAMLPQLEGLDLVTQASPDSRWRSMETAPLVVADSLWGGLSAGVDFLVYFEPNETFLKGLYETVSSEMPYVDSSVILAEGELAGFSADEAKGQVIALLKAAGIDDVASIKAYPLSVGVLHALRDRYVELFADGVEGPQFEEGGEFAQERKDFEALSKAVYDEADEMYVVHLQLEANGMPLAASSPGTRYNMSADVDTLGPCCLRAYVGRQGIRSVNLMGGYGAGTVYHDEYEALLPLDAAINALQQRYGAVAAATLSNVDRIALEYCPLVDGENETGIILVPAWIFRNGDDPDHAIRVSALTGEVI